jgi:hypothetical protein
LSFFGFFFSLRVFMPLAMTFSFDEVGSWQLAVGRSGFTANR